MSPVDHNSQPRPEPGRGMPRGGAELAFTERHYSVQEIAERWGLSVDTVRQLFEREPGVLVMTNRASLGRRRRYTTLRVPESVLQRVHRRLTNV